VKQPFYFRFASLYKPPYIDRKSENIFKYDGEEKEEEEANGVATYGTGRRVE